MRWDKIQSDSLQHVKGMNESFMNIHAFMSHEWDVTSKRQKYSPCQEEKRQLKTRVLTFRFMYCSRKNRHRRHVGQGRLGSRQDVQVYCMIV
jgi:hypothetical protein